MPGVPGYTSPGHVDPAHKTTGNAPHTDLHDATTDAVDLVAANVPTDIDDLVDVDRTLDVPDGSKALGVNPGTGVIGEMDAATPAPHGSTHAPDGADPIGGLAAAPIVINYDSVTGWPLRATYSTNTNRMAWWVSRVAGVAAPTGAGYMIDNLDAFFVVNS